MRPLLLALILTTSSYTFSATLHYDHPDGNRDYKIETNGLNVTGGTAVGSKNWIVVGGYYDDLRLVVTFFTPELSGCRRFQTHNYVVRDNHLTLKSYTSCNKVIDGKNRPYKFK